MLIAAVTIPLHGQPYVIRDHYGVFLNAQLVGAIRGGGCRQPGLGRPDRYRALPQLCPRN